MEITIECKVGTYTVIKGTVEAVTGLTDGSLVVTCNDFVEKRIYMTKNGLHVPLLEYTPGALHHTKYALDNYFGLNAPLATDDIIYIETISI